MQNKGKSLPRVGNFGNGSKEGATDEESRDKEKRKEEPAGSISEAVGDEEKVEGRTKIEKERKKREVEVGRRRKARCDERENNVDTGR